MIFQRQIKSRRMTILMGLSLSVCILFLQDGFTYYWSFQTLALILLFGMILNCKPQIINLGSLSLFVLILAVFIGLRVIYAPLVVSENSDNIYFTFIGIVAYAMMIVIGPNIVMKSSETMLQFCRFVSVVILIAIAGLICLTELSVIPSFTRETLILRHSELITNFISSEVLMDNIAYRTQNGISGDLALFYGEHSFLSIVIFTCITSKLICEAYLKKVSFFKYKQQIKINNNRLFTITSDNSQSFVIFLAIASMIYIKSFSSLFYFIVLLISYMLAINPYKFLQKLSFGRLLIVFLVAGVLGWIGLLTFEYYCNRLITVSDSISFEQRYSVLFDFGWEEYLMGISDDFNRPPNGFQNGILYVIGLSGIGGICWLTYLLGRVYQLARPLGLSFLAIMCVLGIFSQNGGIFSPNKVVLLLMILLPLACANQNRFSNRMEEKASMIKI